jgi:hypothetical protein
MFRGHEAADSRSRDRGAAHTMVRWPLRKSLKPVLRRVKRLTLITVLSWRP